MICKVAQNLPAILESEDGPLKKNEAWRLRRKDGPLREVVGKLFGVSARTTGRVAKEACIASRILVTSQPDGPRGKYPSKIATKVTIPND